MDQGPPPGFHWAPAGPAAPFLFAHPPSASERAALERQLHTLLGLGGAANPALVNAPTAAEVEAAELAALRAAAPPAPVSAPAAATSSPQSRRVTDKRKPRGGGAQNRSAPRGPAAMEPSAPPVDQPPPAPVAVAPPPPAPEAAPVPAITASSSSPSHDTAARKSKKRADKPTLTQQRAAQLSAEIQRLFDDLAMSADEMTARQSTVQRLQRLADELFVGRGPKLHLFGSSVNGFGFAGADMDMVLMVSQMEPSEHAAAVETLHEVFVKLGYEGLLALPKARVPVIKFKDPATGFGCDICFNNGLAIRNSLLLSAYASIDVRVRPLVFAVKKWAKARRVNSAFEGTLSSYAYVLCVILFLQTRRQPILPVLQDMTAMRGRNRPQVMVDGFDTYYYYDLDDARLRNFGARNTENLGRLLFEFFMFFGWSFNFKHRVVSPRTGRLLSKEDKGWTKPVDKVTHNKYWFCIEDPFETSHNLGRTVDKGSLDNLRYEFRRGACILGGTFPFRETHGDAAVGKDTPLEQLLTPFATSERPPKL